ncbi:MAG TPA: winged helix domain-containing protein, partial [Polyangia bacterium]|nr:winged helix domain-containing protein [Polyangia bacterium]
RLALATRGLTRRGRIYCNGEAQRATAKTQALWTRLVRARELPLPLATDAATRQLLYGWYRAGWLRL